MGFDELRPKRPQVFDGWGVIDNQYRMPVPKAVEPAPGDACGRPGCDGTLALGCGGCPEGYEETDHLCATCVPRDLACTACHQPPEPPKPTTSA